MVESMERRVLMSGNDSVWVDMGSPVMVAEAPASQRSVADGTSNTFLVGEKPPAAGPGEIRYFSGVASRFLAG